MRSSSQITVPAGPPSLLMLSSSFLTKITKVINYVVKSKTFPVVLAASQMLFSVLIKGIRNYNVGF